MHEAVMLLCHKLQIKIAESSRFAEHVNNMIVCGYSTVVLHCIDVMFLLDITYTPCALWINL